MTRVGLVLLFFLFLSNPAYSGFFSMNKTSEVESTNEQPTKELNEITVLDSTDKFIIKRQQEAQKLIAEGLALIKKGEKKKDRNLITRGQIKKEIGEKQLNLLKEQAEQKEMQDERDSW